MFPKSVLTGLHNEQDIHGGFKNGPIIVAYVSLGSSFGYNAETRRLDIQGGAILHFGNYWSSISHMGPEATPRHHLQRNVVSTVLIWKERGP
jgi:hypothetical protein